jgi:DNA-binding transcriptional LysR family regulator
MVLTATPSHPLMRQPFIRPSDLDGTEFISFDDDLPIGREIARYLRSNGVEVNSTIHFDNLQTVKEAVLLGSGISIVPIRVLRSELGEGRLKAVPLAEPGLYRPLGIIHRKRKRFSRAAQAFLDLLRDTPAPEPVAGVSSQRSTFTNQDSFQELTAKSSRRD